MSYLWWFGLAWLAVFVIVFLLMRAGWKRRGRVQAGITKPTIAPPLDDLGEPLFVRDDLLYVATSRVYDQLDRIVVGGLGFRGRADVSVHPEGVRLAIVGEKPILIERAGLRDVGRATWTIDRVVETDGLIRLGWTLGDTGVDTYLRDSDDPQPLLSALQHLITPTGEKTQ